MSRVTTAHQNARRQSSEHWVSMSDLMAGLMMVFLFISIAFMHYVRIERDKIKQVAVAYQTAQVALYQALHDEFSVDLAKWDAEIDRQTLEFRFKSPDVLFGLGSDGLKPQFRAILNDFFPRYLTVLDKFKEQISDIRIEGHTSSDWSGAISDDDAYFKNMVLSQGRTRSVLQYIYEMPSAATHRSWIKKVFSAVGFSSAHPVYNQHGVEVPERSRRVTFKVITNAESQIRKIIQE
ncbi:OmpA family protein [Aeromonas veronii]